VTTAIVIAALGLQFWLSLDSSRIVRMRSPLL